MKITLSKLNDKIAQLNKSAKEIQIVSQAMPPSVHDKLNSKIAA